MCRGPLSLCVRAFTYDRVHTGRKTYIIFFDLFTHNVGRNESTAVRYDGTRGAAKMTRSSAYATTKFCLHYNTDSILQQYY